MWHKPHLLTAVADLLFLALAAALLVAAVVWGAPRLRLFPLQRSAGDARVAVVQRSELEESLAESLLHGNFFTVDLEALRRARSNCPGCDAAEVWRKWPSRIEVAYRGTSGCVAHWGDGQVASWSIPSARFFRPRCPTSSAAAAEWAERVLGRGPASPRGVRPRS
jgi:cell division protein FtsQ